MSVLVKNMEMPKNCGECPVALSGKYCRINQTYTTYIKLPIRPDHCPLVELPEKHGRLIDAIKNGKHLPKGEWLRMSDLSEKDDNRYKCSHCGNVVHHKSRADLYTFNSWCGRCGSDNSRHAMNIEADKCEEDAPTVIEAESEE